MSQLYPVVHQNFTTKENEYSVFCKKLHKIVSLEDNLQNCDSCPYLYGALQGEGVECAWEDTANESFARVVNPQKELLRVSKLVDDDIIKKG